MRGAGFGRLMIVLKRFCLLDYGEDLFCSFCQTPVEYLSRPVIIKLTECQLAVTQLFCNILFGMIRSLLGRNVLCTAIRDKRLKCYFMIICIVIRSTSPNYRVCLFKFLLLHILYFKSHLFLISLNILVKLLLFNNEKCKRKG